MIQIKELNKLEKEGAKAHMRKHGWVPCLIGGNIKGWSNEKMDITIQESEIWFHE